MKYNVGDRVRIKENAWAIDHPTTAFAREMREFCGNEYTVRKITTDNCYKLEEVRADSNGINGDGYWKWVEEWIEDPFGVQLDVKDFEEDELVSLFK